MPSFFCLKSAKFRQNLKNLFKTLVYIRFILYYSYTEYS